MDIYTIHYTIGIQWDEDIFQSANFHALIYFRDWLQEKLAQTVLNVSPIWTACILRQDRKYEWHIRQQALARTTHQGNACTFYTSPG